MKSVKKKYISETYLRDVEEYDYKLVVRLILLK